MKAFAVSVLGWVLVPVLVFAQDKVELNTITSVRVNGSTVEISGNKKPNFTTFTMTDPPRLVIDISEAVFSGVPEEMQVGNGTVTGLRTASYGSDASAIARVLIGYERDVETDIQVSGNSLLVKVAGGAGPAVAEAPASPGTEAAAAGPATAEPGTSAAEATRAAAADREAQEKAAAEAAAAAKADREAQEKAAAEAAAAAKTTEEERRQQEGARAQATRQDEADRRAQQQATAAAAAEDKRRQEETARAEAQARKQAAADERRRQEEAARAEAEAKRLAAAEERRRQQEEARATRVASAEPARRETVSSSPSEVRVSARRKTLTLVGFQQQAATSRVFVRTNEPVRYTVSEGDKEVILELENTRIDVTNNTRPLDTSFFNTSVARVEPDQGARRTVRVSIKLKEQVPYQARQEDNVISLEFQRPPRS